MTPERLATIERLAKSPNFRSVRYEAGIPLGPGRNLFDNETVADLIAHIRDLEAQVRELSDFKEQFIDKEVKWLTAQANWIAERNDLEAQLAAAQCGHQWLLVPVPHYSVAWCPNCGEERVYGPTPPSPGERLRELHKRVAPYNETELTEALTTEVITRRIVATPPSPEEKRCKAVFMPMSSMGGDVCTLPHGHEGQHQWQPPSPEVGA